MLYALGDPLAFTLLLVWTLFALTLHGWVTSLVLLRAGDRRTVQEQRTRPDPRRQLDPFGAIAAATAGVGWSRPVEGPDRRRRGLLLASTLGPAALLAVLGTGLLVAFAAVSGDSVRRRPSPAMQNSTDAWPAFLSFSAPDPALGEAVLLIGGLVLLYTAVLSLVPLPPLAGGRLLFGLAPRTAGWQKAELQLVERNIGVAVLVGVSLLLSPLLYAVLDAVVAPLSRVATGG